MSTRTILAALGVASFLAVPLAAPAAAPAPAHHIRGTVAAVAGDKVTVSTADGPVVVTVTPKTVYAGVVPGNVADITDGTFIGTANVPGAGAARALEVVVFPKSMAGIGEGDYPWDLPAGGGHMSSMTNGTVTEPMKMSSMTNATVSKISGSGEKTVSLTYKGGTKTVVIPPNAPIVRVHPATRALLKVGAHVVMFPPVTGSSFVVIGEQGTVPPM